MTKARELGKLVSQGEVLADGVVQAAEVTGLASVATTGSYTDLTNKPTLATVATSGSYADLTNKPTIPSVTGLASETFVSAQINNLVNAAPTTLDTLKEIADQLALDQSATAAITTVLTGKANTSSLSTVATTGNYTDLTNKPTLASVATSGSYVDLTNKPTIPTLPTLATVATTGSYTDLINKPVGGGSGVTSYTDLTNKPTFATVATTGSYTDLINKPTIPTLPTLATVATTGSYTDLTNKPTISAGNTLVNGLNQVVLGTDGNLTLPGNTSILTSEDSIAVVPDINKSTGIQVDAPGTGTNHVVTIQTNSNGWFFKSDGKIAFPDTTQQSSAWTGTVDYSNVTNKPTLATVATSGSYTDLTNKPIIVNNSSITQNETSVSTNQTIASGFNGQSVGPITVNTGIAVTVATGQRWLVY